MKILVVNMITLRKKGGGSVITQRNVELLEQCFGKDTVSSYNISYYSKNFITFLYALMGYCGGLTPKNLRALKKKVSAEPYDILFINTSKLGRLAKIFKNHIACITFFHNVEFNFAGDYIKRRSLLNKLLYSTVLSALFRNEQAAIQYSKRIITLNMRDSKELFRLYHRNTDFLLPTSFPDQYQETAAIHFDQPSSPENRLLFVGTDFWGNTEGLFWFIEHCLDRIHGELQVVGDGMEKYSHTYPGKKISFKGYVDNLAEYYYKADAVVLPILSGSGMKTKTAEALMYGKTIFGTAEAFEGYDAILESNTNWLCTSSEDFITHINTYLAMKPSKINHNSREIFLRNFSYTIWKERLYTFIATLHT